VPARLQISVCSGYMNCVTLVTNIQTDRHLTSLYEKLSQLS